MVATVKARMLQLVIPSELRKGELTGATAKKLKSGDVIGLAPWTDKAGQKWLIHNDGESGLLTTTWEALEAKGHVSIDRS